MKPSSPSDPSPRPHRHRDRRLVTAYIAYFAAVCASMVAAAAVVTDTVPLVVGGL